MMISNRRATTLFRRLLVVVLAAATLVPAVAGAAVSKEDPATTAEMRKKLTDLRNAYNLRDAKAYAKALQPLMKDAVVQPPAVLVQRYASLEVIAKDGLDGLQPMIYRYAKSIFNVAGKVDAVTISQLRGSIPLAQSLAGSGLEVPCAQVVRAALRDKEFPPPDDIAGLSCFSEDPVIQGVTLSTAGISLPAHDACRTPQNNLIYKLNLPSNVSASASLVEVVNLPFPQVLTWYADYVGWTWVSVSRIQFSPPLPADAQSESFTVRVTTATGVINFPVAFPINRGIQQASCDTTVNVGIGNAQNRPFFGNGPRDPRVWSSATATGTGFPAGLSLAQGTGALAGHGVVTGTVQATALNGSVDISYMQNASTTTKRYSFVVTLRPEPVRAAQLAGVHEIQRGQSVLIQLPDGQGANGTYSWNMWANYQLPAGLSIVHTSNGWFVSGTVDMRATLEMRTVTLVLTSGGQGKFLNLTFDCRRPVTIYTQNTILFPEDIVNPALDCLPTLAVFPSGPILYPACIGIFEALEEIFYNGQVHNTDDDNEDRADILVNYINAQQYDIVALQEVWDGPQTDAELEHIVQDISTSYRIVQGAGPEFGLFPPEFKINSGLLTLVKPVFNQPPTTDHVRVFDNAGGGSDSSSRKGFVATQMFVSDDPAEFLWVINTHAHAQEAGTRADQVQQIQDFVATLGDSHPILLVGDLNIEADENNTMGPSSEYAAMRNTLVDFQDLARGQGLVTDSWYTNAYNHEWSDEHPEKRIDYILLRPGRDFDLDFQSIAIVNNDPLVYPGLCLNWALPTAIRCHYSDHFGLKATLKFRQR